MKTKITLNSLNPPKIVSGNPYFWNGHGGNQKSRTQLEKHYTNQVKDWLEEIIQKYHLKEIGNISITYDSNSVELFFDNEKIAEFSISISRSHYYRHQNFRKLLSLLNRISD